LSNYHLRDMRRKMISGCIEYVEWYIDASAKVSYLSALIVR
jgi:hypothetical protein